MRRYIESALRIKWRLLFTLLIVFALASGALFMAKQGIFTSEARIWVDRAIYLPTDPGTNIYTTPASVQAGIFDELLQTHQFTLSVAQRAGIPMNNVAAENAAVDDLQKHLFVNAVGAHLISVSYTAGKPTFVKPVVDAAIQLFKDETTSDAVNQAQQTLKLYEQERTTDEQQMNKSKDALSSYIQDHPSINPNGTTQDPTYVQLQQQYATDRDRYDQVVAKIDQLNLQVQGKVQLTDIVFRIVDNPTDAQPYQFTVKDLLRNSLLAFAVGLVTMIGLTLVATWTDRAVYTLNDLSTLPLNEDDASSPDLLVGVVPYVKTLGNMRREMVKHTGAKAKATRRGGNPRVTVVEDTNAGRGGPEPVVRPLDALPDGVMPGSGRQ